VKLAEIAAGANEALVDVVAGVAAGKKAIVSGFHDDTGGAAINAELAKQRAFAVRDALIALGVDEARIELNKPEQMQASGTNAQARRVEVVLSAN
jgi:outer membrane protein OmpA-like peptidoglycan-associated protein